MKRVLGASIAVCAACRPGAMRRRLAASWDERVFPPARISISMRSPRPGRRRCPRLIERGRVLFKAKFTTVDGAGRPKATQAIIPTKRKNGVNPPFSRTSGPDSNSCFGCHNDPDHRRLGRRRRQRVRVGRVRERAVRLHRPLLLERAAHDRADGRRARRAAGARDDRGPAGDPRRGDCGGLRERQGRARRSRDQGRAVRLDRRPSRRHRRSRRDRRRRFRSDRRPFSRKGVFTSLRQFTINALNIHHGMEAVERFGVRWTGSHDFAESGVPDAITAGDVSALVAFQATLAAADRQSRSARRLAASGQGRRRDVQRRSAAPRATCRRCR